MIYNYTVDIDHNVFQRRLYTLCYESSSKVAALKSTHCRLPCSALTFGWLRVLCAANI